jgi:hypothetical protein
MQDIQKLLNLVGRRMRTSRFLACLSWALTIGAGVALLLMLVDRLPAESFMPWMWVAPSLAGMAVLAAIAATRVNRPTEHVLALEVDTQLNLREKLSTALHCRHRDDPFAQAAVEDAIGVARNPSVHERAKRAFAVRLPGSWWVSPSLAMIVVMVSMLGQFDAFAGDDTTDPAQVEAIRNVNQGVETFVNDLKEQSELNEEVQALLDDMLNESNDASNVKSEEDARRNAIKKLNDIKNRLEDITEGEKAKGLDALDRKLSDLNIPSDGPAKEMAEALAKGDFEAANKALKDLQQKVEAGEMNAADQDKLAEQMEDLANQMQQLAQQQDQLKKALEQAGMNPQLANQPQALQQAIQNNQNLNQQQQQQLQQMAQAQQMACQACQGLGNALQQMAQQAGNQQQGNQQGQMGQQMGQQLSDLEMAQQLIKQAQAAANACQGKCNNLGQGLGNQQLAQQPQQGQGGQGQNGQGAGGKGPIAKTPFKTQAQKSDTGMNPGDIIASQFFDGAEIRGESKTTLANIIAQVSGGAEEGQAEEIVHRRYEEAHKHYFGELENLTRADAPQPGTGADSPDSDSPDNTETTESDD